MNTTTARTLATPLGGVTALLASVGAAMADNAPMGGGMMTSASTYGHMYGFSSAWLIALAIVVVGVVIVAVLRKSQVSTVIETRARRRHSNRSISKETPE